MHKPRRLPVVREDRTIEIHLPQGHIAIVDWEDAWVCGFTWNLGVTSPTLKYAQRATSDGRWVSLHRTVLGLGRGDSKVVDHIDGDGLNCRRSNMRVVNQKTNVQNQRLARNNTSGFMGVFYSNSAERWIAKINGKRLGEFRTPEEANQIRLSAERKLWGVQPQRAAAHGIDDLV